MASHVIFDDRLVGDTKRLRNDVLGLQINAQQGGILKKIAAGVAITLGELVDELLNPKGGFSQHDPLLIFGDSHLLVECGFECLLKVRFHRRDLLGPSLGIRRPATLLPCVLLRRTPRADLVCSFIRWFGFRQRTERDDRYELHA